MTPRITQKDVAIRVGLSHMTVSLALRGDQSIPDTTRKRIEKAAVELGYSPDPMLAALSSYRQRRRPPAYHANLAWLFSHPDACSTGWGDLRSYYEGARDRARQLGYVLEEIPFTMESRDYKRLRRLLNARNITGLLLAPARLPESETSFDFSRYSAVRLGYSYRAPVLTTVANSQFRTVLTAMQKVVALGYRRVGIILSKVVDARTSWHFLGAYLASQHILPLKDWLVPFYETPGIDPAPAIFDWIKREKIDCVVGAGYNEVYNALIRMGVDIPGTLGWADTQLLENETVFSGIHQNSRQIGAASVDQLVSMMHRDETGIPSIPSHLLIEGTWRDGKTLKRRAKIAA